MNRQTQIALALSALFAACGGGEGSAGGVSTGLPASKQLSELNTSEAKQVCTTLADAFNGVLSNTERERISCTVLALPMVLTVSSDGKAQGDVAKCKELVTRCMNGETISKQKPAFEVETEFVSKEDCEDTGTSNGIQSCGVSVSEFENCANAMLGTFSRKFAAIQCDSLKDPEALQKMDTDDLELSAQPECKALSTKCPDLDFGGN